MNEPSSHPPATPDPSTAGPAVDRGGVPGPRFGRIAEGTPPPLPAGERFDLLLAGPGGARVERIASRGQSDPPEDWYDQPADEFVLLVAGAARLGFADGTERALSAGDWAILPARCRHRVAWTDPDRVTLWLAIHMPQALD